MKRLMTGALAGALGLAACGGGGLSNTTKTSIHVSVAGYIEAHGGLTWVCSITAQKPLADAQGHIDFTEWDKASDRQMNETAADLGLWTGAETKEVRAVLNLAWAANC
jgi:hypothetical protein